MAAQPTLMHFFEFTNMDISIVVPAYNEEKYIGKLFESISSMEIPAEVNLEIIVVLNRCTDNTESIARSFGARVIVDDRKNLSGIKNTGIDAAVGEWIITIDADSWMSKNTLSEIYNAIKTEKFVGGGITIKPERWSLGIAIGYSMFLLPGLFLGLSFGLYWFRKADFYRVGGFDEKKLIAEDVDFLKKLKTYGRSIGKKHNKITAAYITTSCRKFDQFGDWHFVKIFSNPCRVIKAIKGKDSKYLDDNWYENKR